MTTMNEERASLTVEEVEVVARLMHWKGSFPNPWKVVARMYSECAAAAYPNEWEEGAPLMTVAQHERIMAGVRQQCDNLAGEREAFEAWWKLDAEGSENKAAAYEGWKARAAYEQAIQQISAKHSGLGVNQSAIQQP